MRVFNFLWKTFFPGRVFPQIFNFSTPDFQQFQQFSFLLKSYQPFSTIFQQVFNSAKIPQSQSGTGLAKVFNTFNTPYYYYYIRIYYIIARAWEKNFFVPYFLTKKGTKKSREKNALYITSKNHKNLKSWTQKKSNNKNKKPLKTTH